MLALLSVVYAKSQLGQFHCGNARSSQQHQVELFVPQHCGRGVEGRASDKEEAGEFEFLQDRRHVNQAIAQAIVTGNQQRTPGKFKVATAPQPKLIGENRMVLIFDELELLAKLASRHQISIKD